MPARPHTTSSVSARPHPDHRFIRKYMEDKSGQRSISNHPARPGCPVRYGHIPSRRTARLMGDVQTLGVGADSTKRVQNAGDVWADYRGVWPWGLLFWSDEKNTVQTARGHVGASFICHGWTSSAPSLKQFPTGNSWATILSYNRRALCHGERGCWMQEPLALLP